MTSTGSSGPAIKPWKLGVRMVWGRVCLQCQTDRQRCFVHPCHCVNYLLCIVVHVDNDVHNTTRDTTRAVLVASGVE